jgi:hypothetical protein
MKTKVPLLVTTARDKASLFLEEASNATKEGAGERVATVLAFGVFAGSVRTYEASVRLSNKDGIVLFAHNFEEEQHPQRSRGSGEQIEELSETTALMQACSASVTSGYNLDAFKRTRFVRFGRTRDGVIA